MRFQIDQRREELMKKIDDISWEMIDATKKYEAIYLKNVKESFSSFDDNQSLANALNEMEEAYRSPNLLIEAIKDMQRKQEESLSEIQLKLEETAYEVILIINLFISAYFVYNLLVSFCRCKLILF